MQDGRNLVVTEYDLRSILFRAPTHLRESAAARHDPEELLARHQWAAFARSLTAFERVRWMNHPKHTYAAENKPFQLAVAARLGFETPATVIANCLPYKTSHRLAVKALDTFLVRMQESDAFFYTQLLSVHDVNASVLKRMPVILQEAFDGKLDIRVTVVGDKCFAASITRDDQGIEGDWRLAKDSAMFRSFDLPISVSDICIRLVRELGLAFGAIDLIYSNGKFYFLEINPTGEWSWLVEPTGHKIDQAITDWLIAA